MAAPPPSPPPSPRAGRIAIVAIGLVAAGLVFAIGGLAQQSDDPDDDIPTEVRTLLPERGAVAFRQDDVGADLAPFLTGQVAIDDRLIPLDQIDVIDLGAVRRVTFRPGEGKEIVELEPGRHTATIYWWDITDPAPSAGDLGETASFRWEFSVE